MSYIGIGLIVLLFGGMMFISARGNKKRQEEAMKMMQSLKIGDKIVTNAGIYAEIVSMRETDMGRVLLVKTGEDKPSYLTINAAVVVGIDLKKDLVLDKDGNPIDTTDENIKEEILKPKAETDEEESTDKAEEKEEKKETKRIKIKKSSKKEDKN